MPDGFTKPLAERLSAVSQFLVKEGTNGCLLEPGQVFIAPGGHNMEVMRGGVLRVERVPPGSAPTPSIDVMMKSVARTFGPRSVGILLTGMLSDGVTGLKAIKENGGITIAQDEQSSLVYGMPKAAVEAGAAKVVASLLDMPNRITKAVESLCRGHRH
jgi:two-component system chemotaxis response regulator CheB